MKETNYHSRVAICLKNKRETGRDIAPPLLYVTARRLQKNGSSLSKSSRVLLRRAAYCSAMISFGKFRLLHVGTICYWTNNVSSQQHANTPLVAICWHVSQRQRSQCNVHSKVPPPTSPVQCNKTQCTVQVAMLVHGLRAFSGQCG